LKSFVITKHFPNNKTKNNAVNIITITLQIFTTGGAA